MHNKKGILILVVAGILVASVFSYILYKRWTLTGQINPFTNTPLSITQDVSVSGTIGDKIIVVNDRAALLNTIEELQLFEPNRVSLFGGDYSVGHSINQLQIVFVNTPLPHPIIGSSSGPTHASVGTSLDENGKLTVNIYINPNSSDTDEELSRLTHLALFNALYLVSHNIMENDILNQAATYGIQKTEAISPGNTANEIIGFEK